MRIHGYAHKKELTDKQIRFLRFIEGGGIPSKTKI